MKMGITRSPWRYDAAADQALRPDNLRRLAFLRYPSWAVAFPVSLDGPVTLRYRLQIQGLDVMCRLQTFVAGNARKPVDRSGQWTFTTV
jgi:hypothetical protein